MTAMLPAHLTESVNNLGVAAASLTAEIRSDREQRAAENAAVVEGQRTQSRRIMMLLVVVAVLVASLVMISVANRRLGIANSELNRQNARIVERIEDCTTAGGQCYEQSRQRTGEAAQLVIRGTILTQLCLRDHPDGDAEQIETCVADRMRADAAQRDEPAPSGLGPSGEPIPGGGPAPAPS